MEVDLGADGEAQAPRAETAETLITSSCDGSLKQWQYDATHNSLRLENTIVPASPNSLYGASLSPNRLLMVALERYMARIVVTLRTHTDQNPFS